MAIEDLTPFGTLPSAYQGLLSTEDTAALQKRAQVQGLLGAGLALAQGMSRGGAPRSALQNIIGAVAGGFQGAGGAYEGGIKQIGTAQQMQQLKLQRDQAAAQAEAVRQLLQDPTIASDPAAVAYIRANPVEAVKEISQRRMREGELAKIRSARNGGVTPAGSMTAEIDAQIQSLRDNASIAASQGKADQASQFITAANNLTKEKQNIAAANFDFAGLKESVPESLRGNVDFLAKQARDGVIGGDKVFEGIQSIQTAARESAKGNLLGNEAARDYALTQFGTADITKLTQQQRDNALRYSQAANDADRAKIANDGIKLKFETGQEPLVPVTRSSMLGRNQPPPVVATVPAPAAVTAPAPAPAPRAAPAPVAPAPAAPAAPRPRATPALPTTATAFGLPANANLNSVPIIQQPDSLVPPATKQKLLLEKPAFQASIDYTLRQVVDARDAAKRLLAEPKYIKAISGDLGPVLAYAPGFDAYKADALLENIKGRSFVATLQEMRANSKTGGAVGSVAVSEMNTLSNIQASLKAGLGEEEFKKQLQQFIDTADRSIKSLPNDYKQTYGYAGEFEDVIKNRVIAPSGAPRTNVRLSTPEAQEVYEQYRNQTQNPNQRR
jgi:hypothetical protein